MRRLPFPALLVCSTCAVLLVGCESPVALHQSTSSTPPGQTQQSLSFEIAGPSRIDTSGPFSWDALAFGGSGQYQYRWEVTRQAGQQPTTTTTGRKLSLLVADTDGDMVLRLTVTSGNQTRAESFVVRNCIGGCTAGP
jgi:hypothetical protein